jgi:hypothetical protein
MTKVMQPSSPTRGAETRLDLATVANIAVGSQPWSSVEGGMVTTVTVPW